MHPRPIALARSPRSRNQDAISPAAHAGGRPTSCTSTRPEGRSTRSRRGLLGAVDRRPQPRDPADNLALVDHLSTTFAARPGLPSALTALRRASSAALEATSAVGRRAPLPLPDLALPVMTVARDTYLSRMLARGGWQTLPDPARYAARRLYPRSPQRAVARRRRARPPRSEPSRSRRALRLRAALCRLRRRPRRRRAAQLVRAPRRRVPGYLAALADDDNGSASDRPPDAHRLPGLLSRSRAAGIVIRSRAAILFTSPKASAASNVGARSASPPSAPSSSSR